MLDLQFKVNPSARHTLLLLSVNWHRNSLSRRFLPHDVVRKGRTARIGTLRDA